MGGMRAIPSSPMMLLDPIDARSDLSMAASSEAVATVRSPSLWGSASQWGEGG